MAAYLPPRASRILEIGSMNVNGGLRDHAPRNGEYIGLDMEHGPGVDHVVTGLDDWPVENNSFDLVLASSTLEHDPAFWMTFLQMCRKARPGGYIYISAPANGKVHRYPKDYWRFYPDAGLALQDWACSRDIDIMLVESFTAERENDVWNDFCAVFRRGPSENDIVVDFVHTQVPSTNVISWRTHEFIRPNEFPEDMRLLESSSEERSRWEHHAMHVAHEAGIRESAIRSELDEAKRTAESASNERDRQAHHLERVLSELEEVQRLQGSHETAFQETKDKNHELGHELAMLRNRIAQRDEEVAQAWQASQISDEEREKLSSALDKAQAQTQEQRGWVLDLALERTRLERKVTELDHQLYEMNRARDATQRKCDVEMQACISLRDQIERMAIMDRAKPEMSHVDDLNPQLQSSAIQIAELEETVLQLQSALATATDESKRLDKTANLLTARAEENAAEMASLGDITANLQDIVADVNQQNSWLREVAQILLEEHNSWRTLLSGSSARERRHRVLQQRGLFNAQAYRNRYPDVINDGQDPLRHFIVHGIVENRKID